MPNPPLKKDNYEIPFGQRRNWRDVSRGKVKIHFIEGFAFTLAILVLSAQFWHFFSLSVLGFVIDIESQELVLLRTSILTLGIIIIAVKFKGALSLFARNFGLFPLLALSFISVVWSFNPAETLQQSILLLLIIIFSFAIVLRYPKTKISSILSISSILILGFELLNLIGNRELVLSQYRLPSLSTAFVFSVWASVENSKWRSVYILAAFLLLILGLITNTASLEIAIIGVITGVLLFFGMNYTKEPPLRLSIIGVIMMCYIAYMVTRFGTRGADFLNMAFSQLGDKVLMGFGFGVNGASIFAKFIYGLGVIGLLMIVLYLLSGFIVGLFTNQKGRGALIPFFGLFALLVFRPLEVDFISLETIGMLVAANLLLRIK